jgi:hypothetical protein
MVISFSPLLFGVAFMRSRIAFSKFVEHHVPQVVQRFSKLHRVDQGTAGPVVPVKPFQVLTRDKEGGNGLSVVADPDFGQVTTHAQQKSTPKKVCGLQTGQKITPYLDIFVMLFGIKNTLITSVCQASYGNFSWIFDIRII